MESVEEINKRLVDKFGNDVGMRNPRYRIINTANETEVRYGTFADFDDNGIFIREVTEAREVEKYPFYPNHWVLEALQGNDMNPELMTKISYEPVWIFGANNSDLNPIWRAVEILVHTHMFCRTKNAKSPSDIKADELRQYLKEKKIFKEMLQDESPYIPGCLHDGAAVVVPNNFVSSNDKVNK